MNGNKTWQRNLLTSAVTAAMLFGGAFANATPVQGEIGATSEGSLDVTILVPDLVLVNSLDDVTLTYDPGAGDVVATEDFCIWSTPGITYDITFTSANGGGDFLALGGGGSDVEYLVAFASDSGSSSFEAVTEGTALDNGGAGYSANTAATPGCTNPNVSLQITAPETGNLDAAGADSYVDTLTLLVQPN